MRDIRSLKRKYHLSEREVVITVKLRDVLIISGVSIVGTLLLVKLASSLRPLRDISLSCAIFGKQPYGVPTNQITEATEFIRDTTGVRVLVDILNIEAVPEMQYWSDYGCYFLSPWNVPDDVQLTGDIIYLLWESKGMKVCWAGGTWGPGITPVCSIPFDVWWFTEPGDGFFYGGSSIFLHEFCNAASTIAQKLGKLFPAVENCPSGLSKRECYRWCLAYLYDLL